MADIEIGAEGRLELDELLRQYQQRDGGMAIGSPVVIGDGKPGTGKVRYYHLDAEFLDFLRTRRFPFDEI